MVFYAGSHSENRKGNGKDDRGPRLFRRGVHIIDKLAGAARSRVVRANRIFEVLFCREERRASFLKLA
jgi:hypothetical protein